MKIRFGFVSNSSSSSFIILESDINKIKDLKHKDFEWRDYDDFINEINHFINSLNLNKKDIQISYSSNGYNIVIKADAIKKYLLKYGKKYNLKNLLIQNIKENMKYIDFCFTNSTLKLLVKQQKLEEEKYEKIILNLFAESQLILYKSAYQYLRNLKKTNKLAYALIFIKIINSLARNRTRIYRILSNYSDMFQYKHDLDSVIYDLDLNEKLLKEKILSKFDNFKKEFSNFINFYHQHKNIMDNIIDRKLLLLLYESFGLFDYNENLYELIDKSDLNQNVIFFEIQGAGEGYDNIFSTTMYNAGSKKWIKDPKKLIYFE